MPVYYRSVIMCTLLLWLIALPEEDKAEGAAGSQWPSGPQRSYSQDCNFENNTYSVGDCVYVQPSEANLQPHIVCIEKLWKDEAGACILTFFFIIAVA